VSVRERSIIHLNVTDFAVAVERICDTSLASIPLIVAPAHAARGIVYDMSEEAYQDGVKKGMPLSLARRYCPKAHILDPRISVYRKAMTALVKEVAIYTPLVEQGEEDGHLFMDVTGTHRLHGPPPDIAWRLRKRVVKSLGLEPVWSLGSNKLVAKVASRVVRPFGEMIVGSGDEFAFMEPLPLALLPGLKVAERKIMADFNLLTIGDLARLSRQQLLVPFQKRGRYLYDASHGFDTAPVFTGLNSSLKITREHIFAEDTQKLKELKIVLTGFVHEMGRSLRKKKMLTRRVVVSLSYSDGRSASRQATDKNGTDNDFMLRSLALTALSRSWQRRIRIRSCVLSCDRFLPRSQQQSLFSLQSAEELQQKKLLAAMDAVCDRFGTNSLRLGSCV
jgi:DNA polymerase-4